MRPMNGREADSRTDPLSFASSFTEGAPRDIAEDVFQAYGKGTMSMSERASRPVRASGERVT